MSPEKQFTERQKQAMVDAVRQAERDTSGEIRVHIENRCPKPVLDRATDVFARLKMHKTALRNGVLVYIALRDRKLAIIGDAGINAEIYPEAAKMKKQLAYADKKAIPFVALVGENEMANHTLTLKDMVSGTQESISIDALIEKLNK